MEERNYIATKCASRLVLTHWFDSVRYCDEFTRKGNLIQGHSWCDTFVIPHKLQVNPTNIKNLNHCKTLFVRVCILWHRASGFDKDFMEIAKWLLMMAQILLCMCMPKQISGNFSQPHKALKVYERWEQEKKTLRLFILSELIKPFFKLLLFWVVWTKAKYLRKKKGNQLHNTSKWNCFSHCFRVCVCVYQCDESQIHLLS